MTQKALCDLAPSHLTNLVSHHFPPHSVCPSHTSHLSFCHLNIPLTCSSFCLGGFSPRSSQGLTLIFQISAQMLPASVSFHNHLSQSRLYYSLPVFCYLILFSSQYLLVSEIKIFITYSPSTPHQRKKLCLPVHQFS